MITVSQALELVREKFGTVRAEWYDALEKTVHSKNITVSDWNFLVEKLAVVSADIDGFFEVFDAIANAEAHRNCVPDMSAVLDRMMFEKFGGTYNGVTYDNPDYYFNLTNWEVLLRCNRAYVQAYDEDNDLRLGEDGRGLYCLTALLRYGGIAFTSSEGIAVDVQVPRYPWMRKDEWVETYRAQNPDSELSDEEIMTDYPPAWTDYPFMSTICERRPDGRIRIPRTFAGLTDEQARQLAAPKDYVDTKATEAVEKAVKSANEYTDKNAAPKLKPDSGNTYAYCYNGAGIELPIIIGANTPLPNSIVRRNNNGVVVTATSGGAYDAVNVSWANSHFVANLVGENASNRYVYTSYNGVPKLFLLTKNPSATAGDTIPFRRPNGRLGVGVPVDDVDAVPKSYFDAMKKDLTDLIASLTARVLKLEGYHIEGTLGLAYTLSADGTYYSCSGIGTATDTDIVIASNIDGIPVTTVYGSAFKDNTSLTSVIIPDSVTNIVSRAFRGCTSLMNVTIPDSVTNIGAQAFYGCTSLTSVDIPDSVTEINTQTYRNCTSLTSVVIGNGIRYIVTDAFENCNALVDIYVPWAEGAKSGAPWGATNATIHYNSEV